MTSTQYLHPPRPLNPHGKPRRVGFEFEYVGLELRQAAEIVRDVFGGSIVEETEFHWRVLTPQLGEFSVECDSKFLKEKQYEAAASRLGVELSASDKARFAEVLAEHSDRIVPNEIVTPPLPLARIELMDELNQRFAGAVPDSQLSVAPCGLHLNIEVATWEVSWILAVLRAYSASYERIVRESDVSLLRRLFPYIKPYPAEYLELLERASYLPDRWRMIDDYANLVRTRNMGLDALPLFGFLAPQQLAEHDYLEQELIKPRPAFHYRLPDSRLGDATWNVADEWNQWVSVERIAEASELQRRRLVS
ncbi:MAG: amidoligase family protein [Polyangiaceae bacterium]